MCSVESQDKEMTAMRVEGDLRIGVSLDNLRRLFATFTIFDGKLGYGWGIRWLGGKNQRREWWDGIQIFCIGGVPAQLAISISSGMMA